PIGTFNTAVLIVSSVTVVMAWASLKMKQFGRFKLFQICTVLCALAFLGIKSFEYRDKFKHYEVWLTKPVTVMREGKAVQADRLTGHREGEPLFVTLASVKAGKHDKIEFIPDAHHYSEGRLAARKHDGGEHKPIEIAVTDIKRLSPFAPWHSTYFAI